MNNFIKEIKKNIPFFKGYPTFLIDLIEKNINNLKISDFLLIYPFSDWKLNAIYIAEDYLKLIKFFEFYIENIVKLENKSDKFLTLILAVSTELNCFIKIDFHSYEKNINKNIKDSYEFIKNIFLPSETLTLKELKDKYNIYFEYSIYSDIEKLYQDEYAFANKYHSLKYLAKIYEIYKKNNIKNYGIWQNVETLIFYLYPEGYIHKKTNTKNEITSINIDILNKKIDNFIELIKDNKEIIEKLTYIDKFEKTVNEIYKMFEKIEIKNKNTLNNLINLKNEIEDFKKQKKILNNLIKILEKILI